MSDWRGSLNPLRVFISGRILLMKLNEIVLKEYGSYLKMKYKNKIQELKLEYCTDEHGEYIYLVLIKIKPSQKNKGYGSTIMSELIQYADLHNVRIKLWVTNIYGSDVKRLYGFYQKFGMVLIKNFNDGHMMYYPQKTKL